MHAFVSADHKADLSDLERILDQRIHLYRGKEALYLSLMAESGLGECTDPPSGCALSVHDGASSQTQPADDMLSAAERESAHALEEVQTFERRVLRLLPNSLSALRMKAKVCLCGYSGLREDGHEEVADLLEQLSRIQGP